VGSLFGNNLNHNCHLGGFGWALIAIYFPNSLLINSANYSYLTSMVQEIPPACKYFSRKFILSFKIINLDNFSKRKIKLKNIVKNKTFLEVAKLKSNESKKERKA